MKKFFRQFKTPPGSSRDHFPAVMAGLRDPYNPYHFRKQRGVNLGSWFVLERWIADGPFQSAVHPGQSDLDVALGTNAKANLERHWDTWIKTDDWDWICEHGFNSVRIPIGYYHLCGADPSVLQGTDFEPHFQVYEGAWNRICGAIQEASKRSIGVLIDLHAAPGKQNHDSHAGTSGPSNFFGDIHNRNKTTQVLTYLVRALDTLTNSHNPPLHNIIGIELINEPDANPRHDQMLKDWYGHTTRQIRSINSTIPLFIGECWRLESYAEFIAGLPPSLKSGPVILDHHLYRCFTSTDIHTPAKDHIRNLKTFTAPLFSQLNEVLGRNGSGIIIGEWSGALNEGSITGAPNERREYVDAQLQLFEEHCGGWYFWTYKKDDEDVGWSLRGAIANGCFPAFVGVPNDGGASRSFELGQEADRTIALESAYARHVEYWSKLPGRYHHQSFQKGFIMGWNEAAKMVLSTPSHSKTINQIGFQGSLAKFLVPPEVDSSQYWEYEHGFIQGTTCAEERYCKRTSG